MTLQLPVSRTAVFVTLVLLSMIDPRQAIGQERPVKIVALGTSLTASGGWQTALERQLSDRTGRTVRVITLAQSGATSDWGANHVEAVVAEEPDVVLIEFSVNDASIKHLLTLSRSRSNIEQIIGGLRRSLPETRLLVMSMNPVSGLRALIRPFYNDYVDVHRQVALLNCAEFVDNRPAWQRLSEAERAAAIPDGAHPTPSAAAAVMVPQLVKAILSRRDFRTQEERCGQ